METLTTLVYHHHPLPPTPQKLKPTHLSNFNIYASAKTERLQLQQLNPKTIFTGAAITCCCMSLFPGAANAAAESLFLNEPSNALSIPTWAVHVSSVVEWATAMALVWQYGDKTGIQSWKGLSWGMVPLLGGALCACTWHFFYNSEALEVLVVLQAALTVIGNATMCIAAYRLYVSSQER